MAFWCPSQITHWLVIKYWLRPVSRNHQAHQRRMDALRVTTAVTLNRIEKSLPTNDLRMSFEYSTYTEIYDVSCGT